MYECSGVAVTNYHKLGNLQQQRLTRLWFWRSGPQNQDVSRAMLPLKLQGRILPASSIIVSDGSRCSWLVATSLQSLFLSSCSFFSLSHFCVS